MLFPTCTDSNLQPKVCQRLILPGFPHLLFWISGWEAEAIHCQTGTEVTHVFGILLVGPLPRAFAHQSRQVSAWNRGNQRDNITRCRVQTTNCFYLSALPCSCILLKALVIEGQRYLQTDVIRTRCSELYSEKVFIYPTGLRSEPVFPSTGITQLENLWKKWEVRRCGLKKITETVCCILRSKLRIREK